MKDLKINIGINTYKSFDNLNQRQKLCIKGLQNIKKLYPNNIKLFNLEFNDSNLQYTQFDNTLKLNQTSLDLIDRSSNKIYPVATNIFNTLAKEDCDYFVFLNDDNILQPHFIHSVFDKNTEYDSYIASRIDIQLLDNETCKLLNYNIHGFDLFCIKKTWWLKNKHKFPAMLVGNYYWDTIYYSLCKMHGKTKTLNTLPGCILHPIHNSNSDIQTPENIYNSQISNKDILKIWFNVANNILCDRIDKNGIKNGFPTKNEEILSDQLYKTYEKNINNIC